MNHEKQNHAGNKGAQPEELIEIDQLKHLLRQAMPPIPPSQLEPRTNMWHLVRARIESQQPADIRPRVPWFDWALAALAAAALLIFPGIIPAVLYHF